MTQKRRASAMAVWVLNRVGTGNWNESLAGDLVEEHVTGRSSLWLCTQVLAAIAIGTWRDIRAHKRVAISGIVTGLASAWSLLTLATRLLIDAGFPHAADWHRLHGLAVVAIGFACAVASGWIVGRTHRMHRPVAVFSFLVTVPIVSAIELPLLYWFAPSVFFGSLVPLLPMVLITNLIGAPVAILIGGFWDRPRLQRGV